MQTLEETLARKVYQRDQEKSLSLSSGQIISSGPYGGERLPIQHPMNGILQDTMNSEVCKKESDLGEQGSSYNDHNAPHPRPVLFPGSSVVEPGEDGARQIARLQQKLAQRLGPEYIATRPGASGSGKVPYLEGFKAIDLANEVFGFNGWSSSIVRLDIDFMDEMETRRFNVGVSAIVRITLRDGTFHEDSGYGSADNCRGKAQALEKAKKEAVTDALKRALRTFGRLLGNCLYDRKFTESAMKVKGQPSKFDPADLKRAPEFPAALKQWDGGLQTKEPSEKVNTPRGKVGDAGNDITQPSETRVEEGAQGPRPKGENEDEETARQRRREQALLRQAEIRQRQKDRSKAENLDAAFLPNINRASMNTLKGVPSVKDIDRNEISFSQYSDLDAEVFDTLDILDDNTEATLVGSPNSFQTRKQPPSGYFDASPKDSKGDCLGDVQHEISLDRPKRVHADTTNELGDKRPRNVKR